MSELFDDIGDILVPVLFQKGGGTQKNVSQTNVRFGGRVVETEKLSVSLEICGDMIERRNADTKKANDLKIEKIAKQVLTKWLTIARLTGYKNHDCVALGCQHRQMVIENRGSHTCATALGIKACIGIRSQTMGGLCPDGKVKWVVNEIYVCEGSRIPHWCGSKCKMLGDKHAGDKTCPLTGIVVRKPRVVGEFWKRGGGSIEVMDRETQRGARLFKPHVKRGSVHRTRLDSDEIKLMKGQFTCSTFDEWIYQLTLVETYKEIHNHMIAGIESIAPGNGLVHYKIVACSNIWSLFCEERYYADEKRMENTQHVAESKVKDKMKKLEKKGNVPICWCDLATTYAREISVRRASTFRLYDKESRSRQQSEAVINFIVEYAHAVIRVWCVIRSRTHMGISRQAKFQFDEFVLPCMYKLWVGIEVQSSVPGEHICILPRDDRLGLYLPEEHSITNIIGVRSDFSKIQLNIIEAFNDAVSEYNMSGDDLRIDTIDFNKCAYLFTCIIKSRHAKKRRLDM